MVKSYDIWRQCNDHQMPCDETQIPRSNIHNFVYPEDPLSPRDGKGSEGEMVPLTIRGPRGTPGPWRKIPGQGQDPRAQYLLPQHLRSVHEHDRL